MKYISKKLACLRNFYLNKRVEIGLLICLFATSCFISFFGKINSSSLLSIDEILLAVLLPLIFFLLSPSENYPVTPFDRKVIFERIINARLVFLIIFLLIVPSIILDHSPRMIEPICLLLYSLGIFFVLLIFLRSYRWVASSNITNKSFKNKIRLDYLHSTLKRINANPLELWQDFFNQRKFVIDYNSKNSNSFKLSFIFDFDFVDELFKTIKGIHSSSDSRSYNEVINNLLLLLQDNLSSFLKDNHNGPAISTYETITDFYISCLIGYVSVNTDGSLILDEDFYSLDNMFREYTRIIFDRPDTNLYQGSFFRIISNKINELIQKNSHADKMAQKKVLGAIIHLVRNNGYVIFDSYQGKKLFPFPSKWAITPIFLDKITNDKKSKNKSFLEEVQCLLKKEWFLSYSTWIIKDDNLLFTERQAKRIDYSNKQERISETILRGFNLTIWSDLLMLKKFIFDSFIYENNNSYAYLKSCFDRLLENQKTFGFTDMSYPMISFGFEPSSYKEDEAREEKAANKAHELSDRLTFRLWINRFGRELTRKDIEKILALLKSVHFKDLYKDDQRGFKFVLLYTREIEKLISI